MLYILYGPDTFSAREALRRLLESESPDGSEANTPQVIDGKTATPAEVLQACEQVSLFGGKRIVIVEGLLSRFARTEGRERVSGSRGRKRKPSDVGEWEPFAARVRALPEENLLIILDGETGKTNPLLHALMPTADVQQFTPPTGHDLSRWVQQRADALGGQMGPESARRLAALAGNDLWLLNSEIEKLVTYADGRPVTIEMVDSMIASGLAPSIFMLVDAIVERNQALARHRLEDIYQKGISAGHVFTMVARQLRLIAQVRESRTQRGAGQTPPGELAGLQPFALQRATQQAGRYTEVQVRHALDRVVEADRSIKTGVYSDRMALEMLITDLLRAPAG